jgi:hypothetical protein
MNATACNTEELMEDGNLTAKSVNPIQYGIKKPNGFSRFNRLEIFSTPRKCELRCENTEELEVMCSKCNKMINTIVVFSHSKKCFYDIWKKGGKPIKEDKVSPLFKTSCLLITLHKCIWKSTVLKKKLTTQGIEDLCNICKIAENITEATRDNIDNLIKIQNQANEMQKNLGNNPDSTTFLYFERVILLIQVRRNYNH